MQSLTHDQIEAIRSALQSNDVDEIHKRVLSSMLNEYSGKDSSAVLYVDGAADLHSKTAGIGGVVYINQDEVFSFSEPLFEKTNNEAEYLALFPKLALFHRFLYLIFPILHIYMASLRSHQIAISVSCPLSSEQTQKAS